MIRSPVAPGPETITATGTYDVITGGSGAESVTVTGTYDTANLGSGPDTVDVTGVYDSVTGGSGPDSISVHGSYDAINTGTGEDTINVSGNFDTVAAGTQGFTTAALVNLSGHQHDVCRWAEQLQRHDRRLLAEQRRHDPPDRQRHVVLRGRARDPERFGHADHAERRLDDPAEGHRSHRLELLQLATSSQRELRGVPARVVVCLTPVSSEAERTGFALSIASV